MIKGFQLGAIKYSVEEAESIDDKGLGRAYTAQKKVIISKTHNNADLPKEARDQVLYHEVVHCILEELGREDLSGDENFVQSFSLLLHQFEATKK